jgi:hypothetical protein
MTGLVEQDEPIYPKDVALPGEIERFRRIRLYKGALAAVLLLPLAVLFLFERLAFVIAYVCDAVGNWLSRKTDGWDREQDALSREWHKRARRLRETRQDAQRGGE